MAKTFFGKLIAGIFKIFKGLAPELKMAIHWGVVITEKLKLVIDSPIADILTAIIPGELDEKIKQKLRELLPKIVVELRLVDAASNLTDPQEIMQAAVNIIKQLEGDYKSAFLHDFSILAAQVVSDGKLDWQDAVFLSQWYYEHKFKGKSNVPIPE